jgi:tetratricopeptide (TPR) repeat protein
MVATLRVCSAAAQEPLAKFTSLRVLDFPMPFCEASVRLEVAGDHFVEIENDLPGRTEYNSLIRLYQKKNWFDFSAALAGFHAQFESSPLIEAVEFLDLQSEVERNSEKNETGLRKIENKFRDLLVLYPRSSLGPVLHASLANYYLKTGAYAKALALYRSAREEYPFHSTACIHHFGEGEANFLLGNFDEAKLTFNAVLQKCQSNRLQIAAKVRLVDIQREGAQNLAKVEKEYEKIRAENPTLVSRFHPELLYNLGEMKYRGQNFPSSTFYFNDFARSVSDLHVCQPQLQKRQADLARHDKKKNAEVIGHYLSVFEKYPKSDVGRFSRVHALLLDFSSINEGEAKRRIDILESEIQSMRETNLKNFAKIEEGLALLERKDESGLEVLKPLKERLEGVFRGELDTFIRQALLKQIQEPVPEIANLSDKVKDNEILEPLEKNYTGWFYKTPDAEKAESIYRSLILDRFTDALQSGNVKSAIYKLERWKGSDLFQKKWVDQKVRLQIGSQIAFWWVRQPMGETQAFAKFFIERSDSLSSFLRPEGEPLWVQAAMEMNDGAGIEKSLNFFQKERALAKNRDRQETLAKSAYSLILGRAFRLTKDLKQSEFYLNQVTAPELELNAKMEKIRTFNSAGKSKDAVELGLKMLERKPSSNGKELLPLLRESIVDGKQWKYSDRVFKAAQKIFGNDNSIVPYLTMEGKSLLERGKIKESHELFAQAIKREPAAKDVAETRFNMARCLLRMKDVEGAKREWQEVASLKDEFWSPLAANELKLLEKP